MRDAASSQQMELATLLSRRFRAQGAQDGRRSESFDMANGMF